VVVVLLAFVAAHHQAANSLVRQQSFIDSQVGEVGLHRGPLLRIQRLARFQGVKCRGWVARVIGERIGRQTRWQVITHDSTLRSATGIAPAVDRRATAGIRGTVWNQSSDVNADKMMVSGLRLCSAVFVTGGPAHVDC